MDWPIVRVTGRRNSCAAAVALPAAPSGASHFGPKDRPALCGRPGQGRANMDSFLIRGGTRLKGKIEISGSKNSALPILAACLLADGKTTLHSGPRLSASDSMSKRAGGLGWQVHRDQNTASALPPRVPRP